MSVKCLLIFNSCTVFQPFFADNTDYYFYSRASMRYLHLAMMSPSGEMKSQSNTKSVSPLSLVQQRSKQFIWKTIITVAVQIVILWVICSVALPVEALKDWMKNNPWFSWLFGFLGTLLQLEMFLIPQFQFAFPYNYIVLIIATILIGFPAALPLITVAFWWTFVTWITTMIITAVVVTASVFLRLDILKSFVRLIITTFTMELLYCLIFFPFIHFNLYDILIMLCGFGMMITIIWEMALIVQAILGDRRFTFRDDQHLLCGLLTGMLIIWMQLIISTEVAFIYVLTRSDNNNVDTYL
uniref:Uncharacterized protein n=1 Tax=Trichobilharzia regenti TaxID=157069 RepID=A0AA85JUG4_TRIRE|nr:unnamed protein product [Trichobilharzia regenti]